MRQILALVAANAVLFLLVGELALRGAARIWSTPLLTPPNATSQQLIDAWRGRPQGSIHGRRPNSGGYFDEEFAVARRPGVLRIAALIDSFGVGVVPYEDNFLTLVDEELDATREVEVYNFGVRKLSPVDMLYLYRTEVQAYEPDLVVLFLFIGNDLLLREDPPLLSLDSSYLYTFLRRMLLVARHGGPNVELSDEREPTMSRPEFLELEYARARFAVKDMTYHRRVRKGYLHTFEVIREMHDLIGDRLRVVLMPDEYQVNDSLFALVVGPDPTLYDSKLPNRRLADFLEEQDIPFLDLLDPIRAGNRRRRAYKPYDSHWNRHGNRVAADALREWLSRQLEAAAPGGAAPS